MDLPGKQIAEIAAGVAIAVAVLAGVGDWRHRRRADLDRVGWVDWRSLQLFALAAALVALSFAMNI